METTPSKTSDFDLDSEVKRINALISQWSDEPELVKKRREVRKKEYNVNDMRTAGEIEADETYIARRIVDRNITREKPEFLSYIEASPRLVLFKSKSNPSLDTIALADWFALGMRYRGWNEAWHRAFDACRLHGASFIEVRADKTQPFNLILEYTPREFLIFPKKVRRSIQRCERILRKYEYLPNELEDAVEKYGFDESVVAKITENAKDQNRDEPICVYKAFIKKDDLIWTAWYSESCQNKWLRAPEPLYLGQVDAQQQLVQATKFPFVCILFEYTEEEEILNCKGRAARDLADQDALSDIWTAMVNGTKRAARLQASRVNGPNIEGAQTEVIEGNKIMPYQVDYFQAAYPDPIILQVAQQLGVENQQSAGQVDFAVVNRKDSRKTAKELSLAQQQSSQLSSVTITPVANAEVEVYEMCWEVVQSQVLAGIIVKPDHLPIEVFSDNYVLAPAGDAEVIKRAEKIANLQQDIPLFAGTPIYTEIITKYLELRFPDEAMSLKEKLSSTNLLPVVQQLLSVLQAVPTDTLTPEQQQALQSIMQNAQSAINASGIPGGPQGMAPARSNAAAPPRPEPEETATA